MRRFIPLLALGLSLPALAGHRRGRRPAPRPHPHGRVVVVPPAPGVHVHGPSPFAVGLGLAIAGVVIAQQVPPIVIEIDRSRPPDTIAPPPDAWSDAPVAALPEGPPDVVPDVDLGGEGMLIIDDPVGYDAVEDGPDFPLAIPVGPAPSRHAPPPD